jgi:hypothetical protein
LAHVLIGEPVSTPDQVRGRLSPKHALAREHAMMRQSLHALRGVVLAALIVTTVALGSLRDALVYAPNGAEVDHARHRGGPPPPRPPRGLLRTTFSFVEPA